ncbi:ROK family protein [Streptacidiphilus sp. P02-A3a]|uniref:ROK family protein n=1 Tax=Streptacidiphilus sp. P02-A3a TaxID=2704468 RepID=UPI0015FC6F77|nr:ROK family protein [Streptacidiphilus sp. P02-A3a]QMU71225.1 ROK family protein [Streptacidiphilus sp. P02-A3a]
MTLVGAVDIGGTKIAAGLVAADGTVVRQRSVPTPAAEGPQAVLDAAADLVAELARPGEPVLAVGVGSAGVIDPRTGRVLSATDALPGWAGTDLRGGLGARLGVPVAVDNDVHAHALGEAWRGAAAGVREVLLVAVGTGIGGSQVVDGRVHHGAHSAAGHVGHMPLPEAEGRRCPCGGVGHAEAVAAGPALLAEYRRRRGAAGTRDLADVAARAERGEPTARQVLEDGATALGRLIGGLVNLLDPELVLVTGGVANCGPVWWSSLRVGYHAEALPPLRGVPLEPGLLGHLAPLLGAARLALDLLPELTAR